MKKNIVSNFSSIAAIAMLVLLFGSCKKDTPVPGGGTVDPPIIVPPVTTMFDINNIGDTYESIASFSNYSKWGSHNVHDPSIAKFGEYYYSYSTDVGFGIDVRSGLQVRKSKDLVEWTFVGWVFNSLPTLGANYIKDAGGTAFNSLWAPYILKVGSGYRLYYSLSSAVSRLSVIGLATAPTPDGPWTEKGLAVTSKNDGIVQTNAIDPTVLVTTGGEHWMYYGSAYDGIYVLQLNPESGLAKSAGDKGVRIAQRGFTNGIVNGNIEGPEIIYNATQNKYYLFIAYDWLESKYNVRVARSDNPRGPFTDFNGENINNVKDDGPMIVAPYRFKGHSGYQGTSHCSVFKDDGGQFYMGHQARPGSSKYSMNLHVRKMFWMPDGWPVVSPERYAYEENKDVAKDSITGAWEQIILGYNVVPGYANEQVSPDFQNSTDITIDAAGTINGAAANTWTYAPPLLTLKWGNGFTDMVYVQKGRDWENKKNTVIFTGLNNMGTAVWGKKK